MNSIHKRALKFTCDDKDNGFFKYAMMRAISLHPNGHTALEKTTQIIWILFDIEILQYFG